MKKDDLFFQHSHIVESTVRSFVRRTPSLLPYEEDLVGEGNVKLLEVIDRFLENGEGFSGRFSNYVRISIVTAISDFVRNNSVIRAPKDKWVHVQTGGHFPGANHNFGTEEVEKIILKCIRDRRDSMIVNAMMDADADPDTKNSYAEVARRTGFSRNTVSKRLKAIKKRFDDLTS